MAEVGFSASGTALKSLLSAGFFAATLALVSCSAEKDGSGASGSDQQAPGVSVISVSKQPFTESTEFIGQSEAFQKVDLRARVTGFLTKKAFDDGSIVDEGAELFRIDPAEYDVALDSAKAGLERAEADLLKWKQQLERTTILVEKQTVSKVKLDEAIAAETTARANVSAANADIRAAELNVGYTNIVSPISGRIGKSQIDVGNLIGADSGILATVVALDPIRVVFSVSEKTYLSVQASSKENGVAALVPTIRFANGDVYSHPGELLFVDNQVDTTTGTIRVFLKFPNPDGVLLPGLFVTVIISDEVAEERILVPLSSVQLNQSGSFVLIVDGESKVETRAIKTGDRNGADIVVTSGLDPGETIIVDGIQKVRPGMTVSTSPLVQDK
jgi:membrane fusion protein (multidrug efflux system)